MNKNLIWVKMGYDPLLKSGPFVIILSVKDRLQISLLVLNKFKPIN